MLLDSERIEISVGTYYNGFYFRLCLKASSGSSVDRKLNVDGISMYFEDSIFFGLDSFSDCGNKAAENRVKTVKFTVDDSTIKYVFVIKS